MLRFDDFLITSDYDHTLTGPDGQIPERNLEAIRYFTKNGGAFTVNTGRSGVTARELMEQVPANVPFLLMNGSAVMQNGICLALHPIALEPWAVLNRLAEVFPEVELEIQGLRCHYLWNPSPRRQANHDEMGWPYRVVQSGDNVGTFVKFNVFLPNLTLQESLLTTEQNDEKIRLFDRIETFIQAHWGDKMTVFRSGACLLNVHTRGVSKINAARTLQKQLGKRYLVCIGDEGNDISMLDGADFAYCPADGAVADRYETVCPCGEGAVADVIYKKIPEILAIQP